MSSPLTPLARDVCCRKDMLWGTKLDASVSEQEFLQALGRQQFIKAAGASPIAGLHMFDHGSTGHRIVYIPRTGRIQIRLDPLTSHEDRVRAAAELYELLSLASQEASLHTEEANPGIPG